MEQQQEYLREKVVRYLKHRKEGAAGEPASFVVCPETLPYCQSLPYEGGGKPDRA